MLRYYNRKALVLNYAVDAWYAYDNFDVSCMVNYHGELYIGTSDGRINHFGYEHLNDNGEAIDAYWESGAMAFDRNWQLKYSADMWLIMKPTGKSRLTVTALSNRDNVYAKREVSASTGSSFGGLDFRDFSFAANRAPKVHRVRIKVKKFTYYSLVFSLNSAEYTATILGADIKVRYTGDVKQR